MAQNHLFCYRLISSACSPGWRIQQRVINAEIIFNQLKNKERDLEHSKNMTDTEEAQAAASTSITSIAPSDKDASKSKFPNILVITQIYVLLFFSLHSA